MSDVSDDTLPTEDVLSRISVLAEALIRHPDVGNDVTELLDWVR